MNTFPVLLSVSVQSDVHAGLEAGHTKLLQVFPCSCRSWATRLSQSKEGPAARASVHWLLECWGSAFCLNCTLFIELIALLHRLNKPPWVVFPAWGQLPLLSVAEQLWGTNGAWRKGSGPSWLWCSLWCRKGCLGELLAKLRDMESCRAFVPSKSFISSAVFQSCFLWPFKI